MSIKNIKTPEQLRAEAASKAAEVQERARVAEKTSPDRLAALVDKVAELETRIAALERGRP